jgi:hypothetical protein
MENRAPVNIDMSKKIEKRGRGRPRKPDALTTVLPVMLSEGIIERIDEWAMKNEVESRGAAARALIEAGLAGAAAPKRVKKPKGD